MSDDKERPDRAGDQDPTEPIKPAFPAPGGITGGSVPPAEPIPNAVDPFSPTGGSATPPGGPGGPSGGPGEPPRNRAWWWALGGLVLLAIVAVGIWLATRGDADGDAAASPAPTPSSSDSSPSPSEEPTPDATTTTTPASAGCAATEAGTPAGASTHQVVDVDGDGRPDTAWLTGGADRAFGITTASGATFSAPVTSASPVPAAAIVNLVAAGDGEAPIALVDVGREVLLLSVADCAVTATENAQGQPYTFDKGFTGFGTGVGCTAVDDVLRLAGLDATSADGSSYTVERTFVDLDQAARKATNGQVETVAEGAAATDPVVVTAQETSCGDLVAGGADPGGPVEPQG